MESHGHMNERTDYDAQRKEGEGYYNLKSNNAAEANVKAVWPKDKENVPYERPAPPKENETERVLELQPHSYEFRANNNFFGGRTTFYAQTDSELNQKESTTLDVAAHYNKEAGVWMEPTMV